MDQGSYSRPDGRGQPSLPGTSASNNNYQVNVSRQKTKKWVEAKSQNYDGDDWGADEYDDDEVEPPLPLSPHGPQYGAPQGAPNVPSLHIQTKPPSQPQPPQHQPYPPPQSRPPPPATAQPSQAANTPLSAHPSSAAPASAGSFVPQSASSTYPLSPRSPPDSLPSNTPQAATAGKPLPFVRPSDIYRRMEDDKGRGSSESSRPSADLGSSLSKQTSASPARTTTEPVKPQPPIAPIPAPRTDSHTSVYQDLTKPPVSQAPQQPPVISPRSDPQVSEFVTPSRHVAPDATSEEAKRLSTSPKLPDLARMSVFGADFFSSGFSSTLSSEQIAERRIPEVPKVAPELKVDKAVTSESSTSPFETANVSADKSQVPPAASTAMENAPNKHEIIAPTIYQSPAVATENTGLALPATPAKSKAATDPTKQVAAARSSIDTELSSHSTASARDITPTKPLNVRKDESPVRSFEPPPPLQREPTFGTDTSSPAKESDALRDEIIKTLNSPNQSSREGSEAGLVDSGRKASQGHAGDSTYTLQDYDSYWADTDTVPKVPAQPVQLQPKTMSIVPEKSVQAAAAATVETPAAKALEPSTIEDVKPATTLPAENPAAAVEATPRMSTGQPSASPTASQASKSTSAQQHPKASIVSPFTADLRRRFSWEADDASKQAATPAGAAPAAAAALPPAPPAPVVAMASSSAPTANTASPLVPVPVEAPAAASAPAGVTPIEPTAQPNLTSPRASGAPAPTTASIPAVAITDGHSQESKRLSLADEKDFSTTTSNEQSAPSDEHSALRLSDPAPAPVLSMPRSSGASVTPFKDIVGLSNPSERVAKFNETRVALAVMDTGLDKWLRSLCHDHPEHQSKSFNSYQPSAAAPAGAPAGAKQPAQQPYYQQYLNASTPGSGSSPGRRIGGITMPTNVGGSTFGHSGNQIGTKSKELMQSAGKMGKGLFSKGKNKLRGDKGDTHPPPVQQPKARHDRSGSWAVLGNKLRTEFSAPKEHGHAQQPAEVYSNVSRPGVTIVPQIPESDPVSPLLREASPDKSLPAAQMQSTAHGNSLAAGSIPAAAPATSNVRLSSQIRMVPSETTQGPFSTGMPALPPPVAEDSGVGMLAEPDESGDAPRRQSSFVGLPPIRRSSTFGMKSKARRAAERFPIDEEDSNGVPDLPTSDMMENAMREANAPQSMYRERPAAAPAGPSLQTGDNDGSAVNHQPVSPEHSPERLARQPVMAPPTQPQPMRQPAHPPMMHPGQSGPWKLEESHLAEPLHQSKNRSGHSPISPPMGYGFEKEIGNSAAMAPPPVPAGVRQRTPDVPPSSAQRYPGLFAPHPDQEPTQQQRTSQPYYEEIVNPRHSINEYSIPGVGPPTEERGRGKRNSGIFKEIGDKIARATSRDRKNSFAENNRPPVDVHTDGASESSFGAEEVQDRKWRRSSFLNTLTGRTSVDQGPRQSLNALHRSQTETFPASSTEDMGSTRKRSMVGGVMASFGVNKAGSANAPTSGFASQQVTDDEPQLTPKKKRFSALTKAFQRPNQERPLSGMSLEPTQSAGSSQGQNTRGGIFSNVPFRSSHRGSSAGQMDPAGLEHSRRASFSNLLSTLAGNKGQQHEQQPAPPPRDGGGFPSDDLPQNIPPAPAQAHPADGFPTPNRSGAAAPVLPDQFLDRPQPLFAAGDGNWGMDRPPTSTTVTANEAKVDAGESTTSSAAVIPAVSSLSLSTVTATAKRDDPVAPSEISDSETEDTENARKPSDVTPSVTSRGDEESGDMTRQDTNISEMTPSIVTDAPRLHEQQQTPTAQYPNSPGGYFTHNRTPGAAPSSAGAKGYSQGQPSQYPRDPRDSLTGTYGRGMGQPPAGPLYGQRTQQPAQSANQQQQQQQSQRYMQPTLSQPVSPGQGTATSSKGWKGLKTKMADQMASMSQSSPNSKSERGDKPAPGDKLFNAFKRLSKQQGSAETQHQGGVLPAVQGGQESAGSHLHARNQGQPVVGQPQQKPPQHMQQHQSSPQQMHMRQGFYPSQGPSQQQMPVYMQQQQQQWQPQAEPQYGAVPIPQGYPAVYGHGSTQVPSMYNVGRQHSQHQIPDQGQPHYTSHHQPYAAADDNQHHGNRFAATQAQSLSQRTQAKFQPELQPQEHHSPRPSGTGSEVLSPASTTQRSGSMALSPASDEPRSPHAALTREALAQQDARKDLQVDRLLPDEGRANLGPSNSNRVSQVSNDSGRHGPSPKSEHSPAVSHKQLQPFTSPDSLDNERHVPIASPLSPAAGSSSDAAKPRNDGGAAPDEAAIIIPAKLASDLTGESKGQVSDDSMEKQAKLGKTSDTITTATEHVVELEDTAEARKRTLRMDSQEEKIAYDPEEENPKMTATSYPGQEWNPYGEPGFGEWPE